MSTYCKEFEVHYYEINKYQQATPITILNYLEETAISHSESAGYGIDRLKQDGIGWVLNRWNVIMDEYPLWNERVIIETWPSSFERFYATREFLIKNTQQKVIGRASSLWVFLNIESKRPARIPVQLGETFGINVERATDNPFREFENVDEYEFLKEFYTRRSDIDTNNHVNNTKYVEWMLEAIPDEVYDSFMLRSLEVIYKKEISCGTVIHSRCINISKEDFSPAYIHGIISGESTLSAVARTSWQKR